ncbi:MAG: hypothetical protein KA479_11875 [Saprospiraceae bacterium]|jgi:hypothetical protein|nr:hypothetical protein [Saprospiraceae bacterium]
MNLLFSQTSPFCTYPGTYTDTESSGVNPCAQTFSNEPIVISGSQPVYTSSLGYAIWDNESVVLEADLIVNTNFDIVDTKVKIKPGIKIIVEASSTLTIEHSKLFACEAMWRGIEVKGSAKLLTTEAIINDAQYAILAQRKAILSIKDSKFDRNYIAIKNVLPSSPFSYLGSFQLNDFYGNLINCSAQLLSGYSGQTPSPGSWSYAGMDLEWATLSNIGNNNEAVNQFKGRINNGIVAKACNLTIRNTRFYNIQPAVTNDLQNGNGIISSASKLNITGLGGISATTTTFEGNRGCGIRANTTTLTVKQCHFKNNYRNDIRCPNNVGASAQVIGNYFQNCQNSSGFAHVYLHENGGKGKVEIKENDFSTAYGYDKKGIWFKGYNTSAYSVLSSLNNFDIQGYHTGTFIALTAAEKFNILEDEYRCHSGCQFGIGVYNTGSYFQGKNIFHNKVSPIDSETGVWECGLHAVFAPDLWFCNNKLDNAAKLMHIWGNNAQDLIQVNEFKNAEIATLGKGLYLQNYSSTSLDAVCGEQHCHQNTWLVPAADYYPDKAARNEGDPKLSKFFVNNIATEFPPSSKLSPSSGWFFSDECLPVVEELAGCTIKPITGVLSPYDSLVISGDTSIFSNVVLDHARKLLINRIQSDSLYATSTMAQDFLNDMDSTNIWAFINMENELKSGSAPDESTRTLIEAQLTILDQMNGDLAELDSLLESYSPGSWPDSLIDQKHALNENADSIRNIINDLQTTWDSLALDQLQNAHTDLLSMTVSSAHEQAMVDVYDMLFRIQAGRSNPSAGVVDTLLNIAGLCYDEYGEAVLIARSWLPDTLASPYLGDLDTTCTSSRQLSGLDNPAIGTESIQIQIWPQPASRMLELRTSDNRAISELELMDLIGRRLTIQRGNRNQLEIPHGLSGAYILRVLFEDGNSVVQKVIIHD